MSDHLFLHTPFCLHIPPSWVPLRSIASSLLRTGTLGRLTCSPWWRPGLHLQPFHCYKFTSVGTSAGSAVDCAQPGPASSQRCPSPVLPFQALFARMSELNVRFVTQQLSGQDVLLCDGCLQNDGHQAQMSGGIGMPLSRNI